MKNGEITVRFAAENELARVNELREQVSRLHAENRPDVWSFNRDAVRFYEAAGFETYRQYMEVKP